MNKSKVFTLLAATAALSFGVKAYAAKEIKIADNNTPYTASEVQQLASTAVSMGVGEPVNLNLTNGTLTVTGSNHTSCQFKVGEGDKPKIQGLSCKK